tara:strand:+ start:2088 stop:3323 length:1236 start_codon:yes stop_codon:yes gene_type:complete
MENYQRTERPFLAENLRYYARNMGGFQRNTQKIDPVNSTSSTPSGTTIINLPANSLVSPAINLHATFTTSAAGFLPAHTASLIQRLEVLINGVPVQQINEYGVLYNLIANANMNYSKLLGDFIGLNTVAGHGNVAYTGSIPIWLGLMGSLDPYWVDTGVVGNIQVRITWAANSVLGGAAASTFTVTAISAFCDTAELNDGGLYRSLIAGRLLEGGSLELPFKDYHEAQQARGANSGQMRTAVVGQSIDRIILSQRAAVADSGAVVNGLAPSQVFLADSLVGLFFTIDGVRFPQYTTDNVHEQLMQTRSSWGNLDDPNSGDSLCFIATVDAPQTLQAPTQNQYRDNRWQFAVRINDEEGDRVASGYNTRGMNSDIICTYTGTGGTAGNTLFMFVERTSKLVVMAGQVSQVVL